MLVEAISAAQKINQNVKGLLIGNGPEFESISKQIEKLSLSEIIKLPGYRSDASKLVQCLNLFTLCSLSEGTSMALLEAMAGEVPIVVTDVGGNPEIVAANKTGWVIPSRDTEQLTKVIIEAATNPQLANQYAAAGKQRFEEEFTFDRMIEDYRKVYYEMMNG